MNLMSPAPKRLRYPHLRYEDLVFADSEPQEGGMCRVREAWWTDQNDRDKNGVPAKHHVAIKSLWPTHQSDPDIRMRFELEADLLSNRLDHPCVAVGYSTLKHQDQLHLVMEWAHLTLADVVDARIAQMRNGCQSCTGEQGQRRCPEPRAGGCGLQDRPFFSPSEIVAVLNPVRKALVYTHDKEILHRDIKPDNILLISLPVAVEAGAQGISAYGEDKIVMTQGGKASLFKVVLTDFGIARDQSQRPMTVVNTMIGTPQYMSPEQRIGGPLGKATDIYSLGAVLYELLTGRTPFHMPPANPPKPTAQSRAVLKPFDLVIERAMANTPEDRFEDANEFHRAVRSASQGLSWEEPVGEQTQGQIQSPGSIETGQTTGGCKRIWARVLGIAALVVGAAAAFIGWRAGGRPSTVRIQPITAFDGARDIGRSIPVQSKRIRLIGACESTMADLAATPVAIAVNGSVLPGAPVYCRSTSPGRAELAAEIVPTFDRAGEMLVELRSPLGVAGALTLTREPPPPIPGFGPGSEIPGKTPPGRPIALAPLISVPPNGIVDLDVSPTHVLTDTKEITVMAIGLVPTGKTVSGQAVQVFIEDPRHTRSVAVNKNCQSIGATWKVEHKISGLDLYPGAWKVRIDSNRVNLGEKIFKVVENKQPPCPGGATDCEPYRRSYAACFSRSGKAHKECQTLRNVCTEKPLACQKGRWACSPPRNSDVPRNDFKRRVSNEAGNCLFSGRQHRRFWQADFPGGAPWNRLPVGKFASNPRRHSQQT